MQPHEIAAHRIADAYEQIARELPLLAPEALTILFGTTTPHPDAIPHACDIYRRRAVALRDSAPFVPCTEHELALMNAQVVEEYADQSTRDMVRDHFDRPDWELRAEWDDRCEWDEIEAHNDN
jgi:hypothetical protein